jgi:acyl carrier protein
MNEDQLTQEIRTLVAKVIKRPEEDIYLDANLFTELGIDSLLGVEIFAALDKKYNVNVPEEELRKIHSVNDIISLVKSLLAKKT